VIEPKAPLFPIPTFQPGKKEELGEFYPLIAFLSLGKEGGKKKKGRTPTTPCQFFL